MWFMMSTAFTTSLNGWSYLKDDWAVNVCMLGYSSPQLLTLFGVKFPRKGAPPTPIIGRTGTPVFSSTEWSFWRAIFERRTALAEP